MTKGESGGVFMMIKIGMEVAQDYTVFQLQTPNTTEILKPPRQNNSGKSRDKAVTNMFSPRAQQRENWGGPPPPNVLIMDNL